MRTAACGMLLACLLLTGCSSDPAHRFEGWTVAPLDDPQGLHHEAGPTRILLVNGTSSATASARMSCDWGPSWRLDARDGTLTYDSMVHGELGHPSTAVASFVTDGSCPVSVHLDPAAVAYVPLASTCRDCQLKPGALLPFTLGVNATASVIGVAGNAIWQPWTHVTPVPEGGVRVHFTFPEARGAVWVRDIGHWTLVPRGPGEFQGTQPGFP